MRSFRTTRAALALYDAGSERPDGAVSWRRRTRSYPRRCARSHCKVRSPGQAFRTREPFARSSDLPMFSSPETVKTSDAVGHAVRLLGSAYPPRQSHWALSVVPAGSKAAFGQREADMLVPDRRPGGDGREQCARLSPDCRAARPAAPGKAVSRRRNQSREPVRRHRGRKHRPAPGAASRSRPLRPPTPPCSSRARPEPARNCWRAPFIASARAASAPLSS